MEKYLLDETTYETVDEDGVVHEHVSRKSLQRIKSEPFFMVYIDQVRFYYESPLFNAATKVLFKLMEYAEFNEGKAYINSIRVDEILTRCRISKSTYHSAIKALMDEDIIRKDSTTFTINEQIFWKGEKRVRREMIKYKQQMGSLDYDSTKEKEQDD